MVFKKFISNKILKISILLLIIACITVLITTFAPAYAGEDNHYNFPNDEIKNEASEGMYNFDSSLMSDYLKFTAWAQNGCSYIMTEKDLDGHISIIFNAPS